MMSYKLTRKIASRRLQRRCKYCNTRFVKGNVYYLHRYVSGYDGKVYAPGENKEMVKKENKRYTHRRHLILVD